jgi:hypothetical protein
LDSIAYIDDYFTSDPSPERRQEFENKITSDPIFAEEVAFYLSAKQISKEIAEAEKKSGFRELYGHHKEGQVTLEHKQSTRRLWPYLAAAAIIAALVVGVSIFKSGSPRQLAEQYIQDHFKTLAVTMGNDKNGIENGLRLYNEGKPGEALRQFESIATTDTTSYEAKKYAGIVSLRLKDYDKAINYFSLLENYPNLYANPGKFYHAVALLKRNNQGDREHAKRLLEQVAQYNLEVKEDALQLLNKW